jgi:hypothetical protein
MARRNRVTGNEEVAEAKRFLGDSYVFGAAGPTTFDCSGLIYYALGRLGIKAPRTSEEQWAWVRQFHDPAKLRPGDLIFEQFPGDGTPPGHVVMYAGDSRVIEAPHPGLVVQERIWSPGEAQLIGFGHVPGIDGTRPPPGTGPQPAPSLNLNPFDGFGIPALLTAEATALVKEAVLAGPLILGGAVMVVWGLVKITGADKRLNAAALGQAA